MLKRLPAESSAYIWTEDISHTLKTISEEISSRGFDLGQSWDVDGIRDSPEEKSRGEVDSRSDERLRRIESLWDSLCSGDVFDGAGLVIVNSSEDKNGRLSLSTVAIAKTKLTPNEFKEFLWNTITTVLPSVVPADVDSRELDAALRSVVKWKYEDGWVCFAPTEDDAASWLDIWLGNQEVEHRLEADRVFLTVKRTLEQRQLGAAAISFFVPEELLPFLSTALMSESHVGSRIDVEQWRQLFLNEFRALGGGLFLLTEEGHNQIEELESAWISLDAFALVTTPSHGVLRSIGTSSSPGLDLKVPVLDARLGSFIEFDLDPSELARAKMELLKRQFALRGEAIPGDLESRRDIQWWKQFRRYVECTWIARSDGNRRTNPFSPSVIIQLENPEKAIEHLDATYSSDAIERINGSQLSTHADGVLREGAYIWRYRREWVEEQLELCQEKLTELSEEKRQIQESATASGEENKSEIERVDAEIGAWERSLTNLPQRSARSEAVLLDSWYLGTSVSSEMLGGMNQPKSEARRQLRDLENVTEIVEREFKLESVPCGVVAYWPDRIFLSAMYHSPARAMATLDSTERNKLLSNASADQHRLTRIVYELTRAFDKLVIVISRSEKGFRMNAIHQMAPKQE